MGGRTRGLVALGGLAVAAVGAAAWFLLGGAPVAAPVPPSGVGGANAEAAPPGGPPTASARAETGPATPARDRRGALLGRLVRGRPPVPVPGAVEAADPGGAILARAEVGPDGRFALEGLPRRRPIALRASSPGLLDAALPPFRLLDASPRDLGDILLGPGQRLEALVVDARGAPVAKARVSLRRLATPYETTEWLLRLVDPMPPPPAEFSSATGADGRVAFEALPPAGWYATADAPGHGSAARWIDVAEGAARTEVRLLLRTVHPLSGRVVGDGGKPLAGVEVRAWEQSAVGGGPAPPSCVSDAEGRYRFDALPAGVHVFQGRLPGGVVRQGRAVRIPEVSAFDLFLGAGATVAGRVVADADGAPVAHALVTLQTWDPAGGGEGQSFAATFSDAAGAFRFEEVAPGNLAPVQVRAEGFAPHPSGQGPPDMGRNLAPGSEAVVEVRLVRGATVTGRVTGPGGGAVPGARLSLSSVSQQVGVRVTPTVVTDADGRYRIDGATPGKALASITADGLCQPGFPQDLWQALQGSGALPEAWAVDVPAAGEVVRDFVLGAGSGAEGVVVDASGAAVAGALVQVSGDGAGTVPSAVADAEGRFRLRGITPGDRVVLTATAPPARRGATEPFAVTAGGSVTDLRIALRAAGRVTGRLRREDGAALRAPVLRVAEGTFDPSQPWNWAWREQSATRRVVDADGAFTIDDLAPGTYTLLADDDGAAPIRSKAIQVKEEEDTPSVDLLLPAARPITGRVVRADGTPVAGAALSMTSAATRNHGWGEDGPATGVSGSDGAFSLDDASPGSWVVRATFPGLLDASATVNAGATDVVLTLIEGQSIAGVVVADPEGTPITDIPVFARPSASVAGPVRQVQATTDSEGRFVLRGLRPSAHVVTVGQTWGEGSGDLVPTTVPGVTPPRDDLRIAVPRGGTIAGRIVDARGGAVAGALLQFQRKGDEAGSSGGGVSPRGAQARPDGTFRVSGLPHGTYALTVYSGMSQGAFAPATVEGVATGTLDLVVRVGEGAPLRGRVLDEAGNPPGTKNLHVMVQPSGGASGQWSPETQWIAVAEDGTFETQPLDPVREYDVSVGNLPQGRIATATGVRAGSGDLVLRIGEGGAISGRVLDEEGRPVAQGVPVRAQADGGPMMHGTGRIGYGATAADGTFTVKGLAAGSFRVSAGGQGSAWQTGVAEGMHAPGAQGVEVRVRPGFTIAGRLVDGTGSAAAIEYVLVDSGTPGESQSWMKVGADRAFSITGLARGRITLKGYVDGRTITLGTFDVPADNLQVAVPAE